MRLDGARGTGCPSANSGLNDRSDEHGGSAEAPQPPEQTQRREECRSEGQDMQQPPTPDAGLGLQEQSARRRKKKTKEERLAQKTAVRVASLNINGFGCLVSDHPNNKWGKAYRMMSEQRIGVLLLQETHLTEQRVSELHRMFAKRIKIFHSAHESAPSQKEGVTICGT